MKYTNVKILFATIFLLCGAGISQAQMVGGSVFLRGQYVEVGIGHLGYYGSDTAAPAGYHSHCGCTTANAIGFVADPLMTGWDTTTTGSHYMGDYFLPGSPFEGWELQADGMRCQAYNSGPFTTAFVYSGGMPACTGSNVSYATSGSIVSGTWQGSIDSITLTQVTTLDTNAMYFTVDVTLTNTASLPKNNIYYFRSLDPDNDETWPGGGFPTGNEVNYQMPDTFGFSAVTATGYSSTHPPLTLGSPDTASRVLVYDEWGLTVTQDLSALYNETYGLSDYTPGSIDPGDIGIGLVINIPHLASVDSAADSVLRVTSTAVRHPANSATMHFFYAFSTDAVDSAIAHYNNPGPGPGTGTLGIQNVNNTPIIKVYPNPAKNDVNVSGLNIADQVTVYDMVGKTVIATQPATKQGVNNFSLGNLPAGGYIISVSDANGNVKANLPMQKQ